MNYEISHYFGGDLTIDGTGDLALSTGVEYSQQRVLRRLLTNPTEYIFHQDYGAGVPAKVGQLVDEQKIKGLIRGQMQLEEGVQTTPEPVVTILTIPSGISARIQYIDAQQNQSAFLSFDASR